MAEIPIAPIHNVFKNYRKVNFVNPYIFNTGDSDAKAFIAAAAITNTTQVNAINKLVADLKSANLWTTMKAIYPFVGGSAASHKFNLKDPRDLDAAFRLAFNGTITHDANGIKGNGTNSYANTFFISNNNLTTDNGHWSFYSRTNLNEAKYDLGATSGGNYNALMTRFNGSFYASYSNTYNAIATVADSLGFYVVNRLGSATTGGFKNGSKLINYTQAGALPLSSFYILAENNGGVAGNYSNKQCAFVTIGNGMSDAGAVTLNTIVQSFQTALGRNV